MSDDSRILRLPSELLAQIIDHSRPDGFESLMLTCKEIHEAGRHLILRHKLCKRWRMFKVDFELDQLKTDNASATEPLHFFRRILDAPKKHQPWLPLYINSIKLRWTSKDDDSEMSVVRQIALEAPWLKDMLLETLNDSPLFLRELDSARLFKQVLDNPDFQFGHLEELEQTEMSKFYSAITFLMLPNLKTISSTQYSLSFKKCHTDLLLTLIREGAGRKFFQKVQNLYIHDGIKVEMDEFLSLFTLPRLKTLDIILNTPNDQVQRQSLSFQKRIRLRNRTLQQLILRSSDILPQDLSEFIAPMEALESLTIGFKPIWTPLEYALSNKDDSLTRLDPQRVLEHRRSSSNSNTGEDENEEPDSDEEIEQASSHLKLKDILNVIKVRLDHPSKLKHLVLSVTPTTRFAWVSPEQRINTFKHFTHLTHLEVNINLLKPSMDKIQTSDGRVRFKPQPLTEILPGSLQVIRLIVDNVDYEVMTRLLGNIRDEKWKLPALRKVHLRVPGNSFKRNQLSRHGKWEDFLSLYVWSGPLNSVGVELVIEEVKDFKGIECIKRWDD